MIRSQIFLIASKIRRSALEISMQRISVIIGSGEVLEDGANERCLKIDVVQRLAPNNENPPPRDRILFAYYLYILRRS